MFVYNVENSKAVDLAEVLNEVYQGLAEEADGDRRGRSGALAERGLGLAGGADQARQRGQQNRNQQQRQPQRRAQLMLGGEEDSTGGALFEQEIRIVADEITNSLVILATPRDFQTIRGVLIELDVVPRQVLIEMVIAEIDLDDGLTLGVQTQIGNGTSTGDGNGNGNGDGNGDGDATFGIGSAALTALNPVGAARSLLFSPNDSSRVDAEIGGSTGLDAVLSFFEGDLQIALEALASQTDTRILSRPHIMTADNQEARILVGQEVPIVTSQQDTNVDTAGTSNILQNIQYRDTGVVVSVTPQVNSEGLVNMVISQEISQVVGSGQQGDVEGIVSPTFTTRETETTVVVNSGETLVISGIIQEISDATESGVPFFKDIPIIGQAFRRTSEQKRTTELIVLITPYVVRDMKEARSVTKQFKSRVDDVLQELNIEDRSREDSHHTVILQKPVT